MAQTMLYPITGIYIVIFSSTSGKIPTSKRKETKMSLNRFMAISAAIMLAAFFALPASAQDTYQQPGQDTYQQPGYGTQPQTGEGVLEKVATAYRDVMEINKEFQQSIQGVENKDERLRLQSAANKQMKTAIENAGLDVETYTRVMTQVREDEELKQAFLNMVNE
ncbi:MAG: DUF4168 domain-containing protein [Desulfobacterales bacterium]